MMKNGINILTEAIPSGKLIEDTIMIEIIAVIMLGKKCMPTLVMIPVMLPVPRVSLLIVLPD